MTAVTTAMRCAEIAPLVDDLVDGTLDERRASAVRGHLRTCAPCARLLEGTAAITQGLRALEQVDPPPTLWAAIDARLAGEEIADGRRPRWWWWWQAWRRPIGYGAALAGAGALALSIYLARQGAGSPAVPPTAAIDQAVPAPSVAPSPPQAPPTPTRYDDALARVEELDAEYAKAVTELKEIARAERGRWKPEVAAAFDENMAAIDAAIDRQRRIAREQPGDVQTLDALHASYRKEIDYLQEAVLRGEVQR